MQFFRFWLVVLMAFPAGVMAQTVVTDTLIIRNTVKANGTIDSTTIKPVKEPAKDTVKAPPPVASSNPTGFHYKLTADGTVTAGNVSRTLLQLGASLDWAASRFFRFASTPTFAYGKQNGLLNERELLTDFRTTLFQERRFYYLAFGSWERSNLRQIRHRLTSGGGIGYKLLSRKNAFLSVTNVLLYEYTDFITNTEGVDDVNALRNSTRVLGDYQWANGRYSLTHTIFLQPALNQPNLRWNGILNFQMKLTSLVSLRTSVQNSYESVVVPGRKRNDFRWTMGVAIQGK